MGTSLPYIQSSAPRLAFRGGVFVTEYALRGKEYRVRFEKVFETFPADLQGGLWADRALTLKF